MLADLSQAALTAIGFAVAGVVFLTVLLWANRKDRDEPESDPLAELMANLPERTPRQNALDSLVKIIEDENEGWDCRRMAVFWHQEVTKTGDLVRAQQFLDSYHGGHVDLLMGVQVRPIPPRYQRPTF